MPDRRTDRDRCGHQDLTREHTERADRDNAADAADRGGRNERTE